MTLSKRGCKASWRPLHSKKAVITFQAYNLVVLSSLAEGRCSSSSLSLAGYTLRKRQTSTWPPSIVPPARPELEVSYPARDLAQSCPNGIDLPLRSRARGKLAHIQATRRTPSIRRCAAQRAHNLSNRLIDLADASKPTDADSLVALINSFPTTATTGTAAQDGEGYTEPEPGPSTPLHLAVQCAKRAYAHLFLAV